MNDQEEFEKWAEKNGHTQIRVRSTELVTVFSDLSREAWQAACEYKQQEIDKWKIAYQQEAEDHMITSNNLQKEIEIRDNEITNLKIEQHFNLKLINELKAENDKLKNYTITGYQIGIEELEAQNKRLDMVKSLYEGRCKKLEMEKHKLIAALLIYAEYENDGSGDMYYNYDIARTTLSEIGHESFEGL